MNAIISFEGVSSGRVGLHAMLAHMDVVQIVWYAETNIFFQ